MNSFSRVDLDVAYLAKARDCYRDESNTVATVQVELPEGSKLAMDAKFIMQRFERMDEMKYDSILEKDYLQRVGGFEEDFVDFIYSVKYPEISYENNTFTLTGTKASIYLSYCALRNLITDHLNNNFLDSELIIENDAIAEGVRKLIVKFDMVRGSDFKFVESGSLYRYSQTWQAIVFTSLISDLKPNMAGTTNPLFAFMYGIPLYIPNGDAVRPVIDSLTDGQEVEGNIYEMMHCYVHRGNRNVYMWSDLMNDVINLGFTINLVV